MSHYIRLLNAIKANLGEQLLTAEQRGAFERLHRLLGSAMTANLYGPAGCGKTVLAWELQRALGAEYSADFGDVQTAGKVLIVDNVPEDRTIFRTLLRRVALLGGSKLVVVSREPIPDDVATVELTADATAIEAMRAGLAVLGWPTTGPAANGWALARAAALGGARGGTGQRSDVHA